MPEASRSERALAVAGRRLGIDLSGAELISSRANDVWRLSGGVIARVTLRPEEFESAGRSLAVAKWLHDQGLPAAPPWRDGPDAPLIIDDQAVTLWEQLDNAQQSTAGLGEALKGIHSSGNPPMPLPIADPVRLARWALQGPEGVLSQDQERYARDRLAELAERYARLTFVLPPGLIHGDAHVPNALGSRGPRKRTVLTDWDFAALGPRELDLIPTALGLDRMAGARRDYDAFRDAYGFDVREWDGFPVLKELTEWWMVGGKLRSSSASSRDAEEARYRINTLMRGRTTQHWHYGKLSRREGAAPTPRRNHSASGIRFKDRYQVAARLAEWTHPADEGEYVASRWPAPFAFPVDRLGVSVAMATYAGDWHKLPASLASLLPSQQPGLDLEVSIAVNHADFIEAKALVDNAGLGHPDLIWDATGANHGEAIGRTLAIFNASKPFLAAGDPDDRWRSGGLTRLAAVASAYCADLAVGRNARFEGDVELEPTPSLREIQGLHNSIALYKRIDWTKHPFPWHPMTFLARTDVIRKLGGWPSVPLGADIGLLLAAMTHDEDSRIVVVPEVVRDRYKWPGQVTQLSRKAELSRWVEVARRLAADRTWDFTQQTLESGGKLSPIIVAARPLDSLALPSAGALVFGQRARWRAFDKLSRPLSPTAVRVPGRAPGH